MKNLAPEIFRQKLLIEGYYTIEVTRESLAGYLTGVAKRSRPCRVPGASGLLARKFVSILLYSCKGFDETAAIAFTRQHFSIVGEIATVSI